jgi:drug/metabolite transporter (DMT)-like permease
VGELFALASAIVWALAMMTLKKSGETAPPFALNLFRVIVSIPLFAITLLALNEPLWLQVPRTDLLLLMASGIIGIALSDTLFHAGLNRMGAGITGIVDCLYSPFVVLGAYLALSERLSAWQLAGMVLVVAGVGIASKHRPPVGAPRRHLLIGVLYGVLAMATVAISIIIHKAGWGTAGHGADRPAVAPPSGALPAAAAAPPMEASGAGGHPWLLHVGHAVDRRDEVHGSGHRGYPQPVKLDLRAGLRLALSPRVVHRPEGRGQRRGSGRDPDGDARLALTGDIGSESSSREW